MLTCINVIIRHLLLSVFYFLMSSDNSRVISQYTDQVEEQHVYIKETVDSVFPSNIRVLQVNWGYRTINTGG